MKPKQISQTAKAAAVHRALITERPLKDRICNDPFARQLVGKKYTACGDVRLPQGVALWLFRKGWPGFHEYFAMRTKYLDDYLIKNIKSGITQVVILGAGYDARAYRIKQLQQNINVFEVDNAATQQDKKERLKQVIGQLPKHVSYVSIDFNQDTLEKKLFDKGYRPNLKTLFLWEGVTYYIRAEAVDETLKFVKTHSGKGSTIIFDYTYPEVIKGTSKQKEAKIWRKYGKKLGEELIFGIEKGSIEKFLNQRKLSLVQNADHDFLEKKYLKEMRTKSKVSPIFAIASAQVNGKEAHQN